MRERPKEFWRVAAVLAAVALSFPLQVMLSYGYHPTEISQTLAGLAPLNWMVIFVSLIHAVLVFQASPWILLSTPIFLGSVAWNNWVVAWAGINYSSFVVFLASLGAIATHLPLFSREARKIILNPKLRWWLTPPRKRVTVQAVIRPVLGGELRSMTFDLSSGGAFIDLNRSDWTSITQSSARRNLKVGSRCSIRLMINQTHVLTCGAEVVRHANPAGERPGGFAVRFVSLDETQRKLLNSCMKNDLNSATAA